MITRILIIGGGFGGLETAFSLKELLPERTARITLVDRNSFHSFIPSIHLIISGKVTAREISIPLPVVLGAAGIAFTRDVVERVDTGNRRVVTATGAVPYDYLVLASGAAANYFDIPGAREFSCGFRSAEDAERIRSKVLSVLSEGARPCRLVVAGAGNEGVEVVGELLDLVDAEGHEEERLAGAISVELIEGKRWLVPALNLAAQGRVEQELTRRGVLLSAGDPIAEVGKEGLVLASGRAVPASILIWTGGIRPSSLIDALPYPKDPWGWLKVNDRLQVPDDERIYGIGDAVSIYTDDGPLGLQRLAYHALDQAPIAALNISRAISGLRASAYIAKKRPQLISLGRKTGVFMFEDRVSSGPWVVSLKKAVERRHLLACLARPVTSRLQARLPGTGLLVRLRNKLPV